MKIVTTNIDNISIVKKKKKKIQQHISQLALPYDKFLDKHWYIKQGG